MGVCESIHDDKKEALQTNQNSKNQEEENSNNKETHPSTNSQNENKNSKNLEIQEIEEIQENKNKIPELAKYERSWKKSEFSHINNTTSMFSSKVTEEEVIIRGEINKNCKNKEEDFDNNSFKKLVKNNGGIIINNGDKTSNFNSNICSSIAKEPTNDYRLGKENISEIKSFHSFPFMQINGNLITNLRGSGNTFDLIQRTKSEKNKNCLGQKKNDDIRNKNLRESNRINVSMQDNYQFLNVPKVDEPLPDFDELSTESPLFMGRSSLISQ